MAEGISLEQLDIAEKLLGALKALEAWADHAGNSHFGAATTTVEVRRVTKIHTGTECVRQVLFNVLAQLDADGRDPIATRVLDDYLGRDILTHHVRS